MVDTIVLGPTRVEAAAAELMRVIDETTRAFDAMILALERASGAERASESALAEARSTEAFDFAQQASNGLAASSELVSPLRTLSRGITAPSRVD